MRGEKPRTAESMCSCMGSPPRARGEVTLPPRLRSGARITPACAGRSWWSFRYYFWWQDHPRVRGEKAGSSKEEPPATGSPPRARGEDSIRAIARLPEGITPACAGRSSCQSRLGERSGDHPRVRGEKTKKIPYGRPFSFPAQGISFSLAYSCTILSQSFCAR